MAPGLLLFRENFLVSAVRRSASSPFSRRERAGVTAARPRFLAPLGLPADLQVGGRLEEARVAVFLHQGVDFGLGQLEAGLPGVLHVLLCDGFGHMVQIHLMGMFLMMYLFI